MVVHPDFISALSAQKFIDWNIVKFSGDIPQCNINGGHCTHDRCTPEMGEAVEILPMVFDVQRVFSNQVIPKYQNRRS